MKQYLRPEQSRYNKYSIGQHFFGFFHKIELPLTTILCLIFIVMSKSNSGLTNGISNVIYNTSIPILRTLSYPFTTTASLIFDFQELVNAKKKNKILKEENQSLQKILIESVYIKNENKELKEVLRFVTPRSTNYMMVQVIGKSYGLFNHNLTIRHYDEGQIKDGSIAIFKKSVVGRVVRSFNDEAKVMLLTDAKSRIPVISGSSRNRGILAGYNSDLMEIKYLAKNHAIAEGELIFTSSDGDQIPPGILAGVVTKVKAGKVYVKIAEDIANVDHLTILQY